MFIGGVFLEAPPVPRNELSGAVRTFSATEISHSLIFLCIKPNTAPVSLLKLTAQDNRDLANENAVTDTHAQRIASACIILCSWLN